MNISLEKDTNYEMENSVLGEIQNMNQYYRQLRKEYFPICHLISSKMTLLDGIVECVKQKEEVSNSKLYDDDD